MSRPVTILCALMVLLSGLWPRLPLLRAGAVGNGTAVGLPSPCGCGCAPEPGDSCCCTTAENPVPAGSATDPCLQSAPCDPRSWTSLALEPLKTLPPGALRIQDDQARGLNPLPSSPALARGLFLVPDTPPPILPAEYGR